MREYEMRLHNRDDALSVIMKTVAIDDSDARSVASSFLIGDIVLAHVSRGDKDVGIVRRAFVSSPVRRTAATSRLPVYADAAWQS